MIAKLRHFFKSLTGRLLMSAVLWSMAALAIGGYSLSLLFQSYLLRDFDDDLSLLLDSMVGVSEISRDGVIRFGRPLADQRFVTPESGSYWQISESGQLPFRSRSLWDFEFTPDAEHRTFALRFYETVGPGGQTVRVAERDIILPESDRLFHYLVAKDTASVQAAIYEFNRFLIFALSALVLTVTMALVVQVSYGLRPLRRLRGSLSDIRTGRGTRIEGDWPEDLQPLAEEINALIEQNEKLLDRARTHVGNLAHALKTPLAVIQNDVEGADDKKSIRIKTQTSLILDHVNHHLKRARIAGGGSGLGLLIDERLQKIIKAVSIANRERGIGFTLNCPQEMRFDGEKQDFDELMGNLIDNAGKWARSTVQIRVQAVADSPRRPFMEIRVEDDGPGVAEAELEALFERGKRLDERVPGTGLGLAIVRDIVEMYGGNAQLELAPSGGLRAIVRLPSK